MSNVKLPYVPSPGSIRTALDRIRAAATPSRVTPDFVSTVLLIKGGTGKAIAPYLKRVGFVASDGTPTEIYRRFRNPTTGGSAAAESVKIGYKDLATANEYFYKLSDKELRALIVQVTGLDHDNKVVTLILSSLNAVKGFANFETAEAEPAQLLPTANTHLDSHPKQRQHFDEGPASQVSKLGLNLSYTINLNLPATSDQAVFNAIFKSLKEHLLAHDE